MAELAQNSPLLAEQVSHVALVRMTGTTCPSSAKYAPSMMTNTAIPTAAHSSGVVLLKLFSVPLRTPPVPSRTSVPALLHVPYRLTWAALGRQMAVGPSLFPLMPAGRLDSYLAFPQSPRLAAVQMCHPSKALPRHQRSPVFRLSVHASQTLYKKESGTAICVWQAPEYQSIDRRAIAAWEIILANDFQRKIFLNEDVWAFNKIQNSSRENTSYTPKFANCMAFQITFTVTSPRQLEVLYQLAAPQYSPTILQSHSKAHLQLALEKNTPPQNKP